MKRMSKALVVLALAVGSAMAQRPHHPFVERVVTPDRARQLKVALHADLWVMYDLPQAQLYQAWKGGAKGGTLQMANFGWFNQNAHFAHWFTTAGENYFKDDVGEYFASWTKPADIETYYTKWKKQPRNYQAWNVSSGGTKTLYRGYMLKGTDVTINFSLFSGGKEIKVTEVPNHSADGGKTNLIRKLNFTGIPAGVTVSLKLAGTGWAASGKGQVQAGNLVVSGDGETILTGSW